MSACQNKKRLKLGIIFNFNPSWMGGIIYILNLIKILDYLDDKDKPEIILFYRYDLKKFVDEIRYHYLKPLEWRFWPIYKGYLISWLTHKNIFIDDILKQHNLDGLYPIHDYPVPTITRTKLVSWYADLQHKYYPDFFSRRKIIERNTRIRFMLKNSSDLVVSSKSVACDFEKFYRFNKQLKIHLFHFVSVIDDIEKLEIDEIKARYGLPCRYFMISNQFHKHKNHKILFKTVAALKEMGTTVHLVLTGRFQDKAHAPFIKELHTIIKESHIVSQVTFTGVIPRKEQLILMKHAQAVIQPSLFEGWSTVIEDARSLQVPVLASRIPVNVEQLGPEGVYFNPHDDNELAEIIDSLPARNLNDVLYGDYTDRMREAAHNFIKIFWN